MKSIKSKLFIAYSLSIFIILFLLSVISLIIFEKNKETKSLKLVNNVYSKVEKIILTKKDSDIKYIDNAIDLKDLFLIIQKNNNLIFTNKSQHNTNKLLNKLAHKLTKKDNNEDEEYDGFIEINDYIVSISFLLKDNNSYKVYIAINEHILEEFLGDIYGWVMFFNLVLFFILIVSGYYLINKTINPLKIILQELKILQNKKDLSLRLEKQSSDDEFEELVNSFNKMLSWIEYSVENIKQFSSDASHELKTPLTIIQGEIELCKSSNKTKDELIETIEKIDLQQKNLQNIINDFLLLAKLDKEILKNEIAHLDKVIFEAIELNLESIEKKCLVLKIDIDDELLIEFNEKYLFIVVNNLLTNAIKYTNKGFIKIVAKQEDKKIYFEIIDSGIGIDNKNINKIFERFYRVDKARTMTTDGMGLGLSIVDKICKKFNYEIKVQSELKKGSIFRISKIN